MSEAPRAPRSSRAILLGGGLLLLFVALALLGLSGLANARWENVRGEIRARLARRAAEPTSTRPNVFASESDGSAWSDWTPAIQGLAMATLEPMAAVLRGEVEATDPAALDLVIAANEAALAALLAGAHRNVGRFPADGALRHRVLDNALAPLEFGRLGAVAAERAMARGDVIAAIDLALASVQFGRDLLDHAPLLSAAVGTAVITRALHVLAHWLANAQLEVGHRRRVAQALAVIDDGWPASSLVLASEHDWMLGEFGLAGESAPKADAIGIPFLSLWRHGFSMRNAMADWWHLAQAREAVANRADALDWPTADSELRAVEDPGTTRVLRMLSAQFVDFEGSLREARAMLRVLREAFATADGVALSLADPCGAGPLRRTQQEGRTRIWSVGRDHVDGSGVGWLVQPRDGGDIAIEIER